MTDRALIPVAALPAWLRPLADAAVHVTADQITAFRPPPDGGRAAAVLMLLAGSSGPGDARSGHGPDLLLISRAREMNSHAGQPAFPGGAADPGDAGPIDTAIREAIEETGLDPAGVAPFAVLPALYVPVSGFTVTPVLAWWREPSPVRVVDVAEVRSVHRVPLDELLDPERRVRARHESGFESPAFDVDGLLVWGFTGGLLSFVLSLGGWERPWDQSRIRAVTTLGDS